jgi:hypothetical protein
MIVVMKVSDREGNMQTQLERPRGLIEVQGRLPSKVPAARHVVVLRISYLIRTTVR